MILSLFLLMLFAFEEMLKKNEWETTTSSGCNHEKMSLKTFKHSKSKSVYQLNVESSERIVSDFE